MGPRSLAKGTFDDSARSQARKVLLKRRAEFQDEIEKVMRDGDWYTTTPETMQERCAGLALIRELWRRNLWHLVDDSWQAAMMPEGALVTCISEKKIIFRCARLQRGRVALASSAGSFPVMGT